MGQNVVKRDQNVFLSDSEAPRVPNSPLGGDPDGVRRVIQRFKGGDLGRPKSRKNRNFQIVPKLHQMGQNVVKRA